MCEPDWGKKLGWREVGVAPTSDGGVGLPGWQVETESQQCALWAMLPRVGG